MGGMVALGKLDPEAKNTFEGPPAGEGAVFHWAGKRKVGAGRMKITESNPDYLIRIKLDFLKPFPSTSNVEFVFNPEDSQTAVTWTMSGEKTSSAKGFACL